MVAEHRGLRAIARMAGVSLATAQRALTHPGLVAEKTRARIRMIAAQMDYVPNATARALSLGESGVIGLAVSSLTNPIFAGTIAAFGEAVRAAGKQVLLADTGFDTAREDGAIRALIGRAPDGIVMTFAPVDPSLVRLLRAWNRPVIELWGDPVDAGWHVAGMDNAEIGRQAARHFLATGRRRPALFGSLFRRDVQRWEGFREVCIAALGRDPRRILYREGTNNLEETFDLGEFCLDATAGLPDAPDAIYCTNDVSAAGVVLAAIRRGLAVPAALAVCGTGDQPFAAAMIPRLTTIAVPGEAMGRAAAALVLAALPTSPVRRIFPTELILRETG